MRHLILLLTLCLNLSLVAQELDIPKDVTYEGEADYAAQAETVVAVTDWLLETPVNMDPYKRQQANTYLMQWLTGTPTVTLSLSQDVVPFMDCGECLMAYMGSYAKHAIRQPDREAKNWNYAAVKDVLSFYEANKAAVGKNKSLEKFAKLEAKGKLEAKIHDATL